MLQCDKTFLVSDHGRYRTRIIAGDPACRLRATRRSATIASGLGLGFVCVGRVKRHAVDGNPGAAAGSNYPRATDQAANGPEIAAMRNYLS